MFFFVGGVYIYLNKNCIYVHILQLFGSGFFSGPVLDYFSRRHLV